ncbi:hypothetical protein AWJ20_1052 [Sugiyamaella lignohabitans]|uniref:DASH complex subunit ASK1 n=1 Tax=Sugiyamaella lignohabitans TaxID=796027 RepID=A0A167DD67_9ASCO|nr:uncharacterized protein AWJ20_1052 [Sugiyamaella lignohabitans]ANB12782.1 hypothetical protein AWJ20_1052 [Sugiyamaella lignohabitans]
MIPGTAGSGNGAFQKLTSNANRRLTVAGSTRSRNTGAPTSNTALAEELEKTEQSITLALQEIDKNFAQANRIISESILPSIEKYSQESRRLWDNAGFWKDFLESSAEVTLSTYEEIAAPMGSLSIDKESIYDTTNMTMPGEQEYDPDNEDEYLRQHGHGHGQLYGPETGLQGLNRDRAYENQQQQQYSPDNFRRSRGRFLDDDITPANQSTPLKLGSPVGSQRKIKRSPSRIPVLTDPEKSPHRSPLRLNDQTTLAPPTGMGHTQNTRNAAYDNSMDDSSFNIEKPVTRLMSPGRIPQSVLRTPKAGSNSQKPFPTGAANSVLRHQVLNRNWRIQATPKPSKTQQSGVSDVRRSSFLQHLLDEDSSMSDIVAPPKLQSELFSPAPSSLKSASGLTPEPKPSTNIFNDPTTTRNTNNPTTTATTTAASNTYYTSSASTKQHQPTRTETNDAFSKPPSTPANRKLPTFYDETDSDIDHIMDGISPPVTRQFTTAAGTTGQFVKTPARQAVRTIVNDILRTVGGADDSSSMMSQESFLNDHSFTAHGNNDSDSDSDAMDFSL